MAANGSKRQQPADMERVVLNIKCNEGGEEAVVAVKRNIVMKRMLLKFCHHASLDYRSTRFVFNRRPFSHYKTPDQLRLVDYDQIDALVSASGA